jgi:putative salt-induced outer membrane protein YdiY
MEGYRIDETWGARKNTWRLVTWMIPLLLASPLLARPKTDVVFLDNGDRVSCEIKKLERGKLTIKTDASGTITVKWTHVQGIRTDYPFQIELQSGARYAGPVDQLEPGKISVGDDVERTVVETFRVVEMVAIESSILTRMKGSVDAGYDFTQATSATTLSASAEVDYRTPRIEANVSASSNIHTQEGAEDTNRQNVSLLLQRLFQNRWFLAGVGSGEKSQNQGLDFRGLIGGGLGRKLLQTNRSRISFVAGAAFSREKFEDRTESDSNAEIVTALYAETFRFDSPELDLSGGVFVLPNMTTWGRYRIQANGKAKIEILRNLYWSLTIYESYDSEPPSETSRRNDFGITASLGWSFK